MAAAGKTLLQIITDDQFLEIYNNMELYPNLSQVGIGIKARYNEHCGRDRLSRAITELKQRCPEKILNRRAAYDNSRTLTSSRPQIVTEVLEEVVEHKLRVENKNLKDRLAKMEASNHEDATFEGLWRGLANNPVEVPKWLTPKRTDKHSAIPTAFLSDCHFDEVVAAGEINFVNSYDRPIAAARLLKFGDSAIRLGRDYFGTMFEMPRLIMPWGGDMIGGNIHEELKVTNADSIMGTVHYWIGQMVGLVELLLTHYQMIYIPCVVGNHGRNSRKPIAKGRVRDNFDWLLYKQVEFFFHGTDANRKRYANVVFDISDGTECRYKVYNTRYQLTHGDQFRGGQGWGGVAVPIMKGHHKKNQRETATRSPFDIMILGHFHQLLDLGTTIVNGSLKGYDEYAALNNFAFEEPRQAFWLTDPKYGKTFFSPIHVASSLEGDHEEVGVRQVATI